MLPKHKREIYVQYVHTERKLDSLHPFRRLEIKIIKKEAEISNNLFSKETFIYTVENT